ncbi:hypothetical protein [Mucilaginibacter sp. BT774]|uniref:hypothetical protein n=1 Tax=Mucilaginibacter sp. BT774 TaxID=3062276 RepID=UPI0026762E3F|nr:hypothetical protein [Mucilaginibacter sp. BT774]MDO3628284.1 hypothetical protein [Mucilaginibacter sp. BT774]
MKHSFTLIKADYLQRTRSYSFLITLAITVYAAYSFVPPTNAAYTTLNVTGYRGAFNSAWVGYVSATMTAVMLSLYGFLLVNNGIKKDIETEVGLIIATTPITNFGYLIIKLFSNFLVLLTIAGITFAVSMAMFWVRGSGVYPFIFADFITPYVMFAMPALFVVSGLAVVAEVFLGKRSILQFIIYFFICGAVMAGINSPKPGIPTAVFDPFGLSLVTGSIKSQINTEFHENIKEVSFGFIFAKHKSFRTFEWNGVNWNAIFIISRLIWMAFSLSLVYLSSFFFHRFDFNQTVSKKKKALAPDYQAGSTDTNPSSITTGTLPPVVTDYGIFPFIKTELLLLIRKGAKWFWLVTGGVWIAMLFTPLDIAHTYLLPVIWFLQVTRLSELVTKERTNRLHYFTYSSYKPLLRMLPAQILAGVLLVVVLALPVMGRYLIGLNFYAVFNILWGAIFIVILAVCLGIVSGGKKLFEIVFFMLTYGVTQKIPFIDYLGVTPHPDHTAYIAVIGLLILSLGALSFFVRNYQARHL